jgi:hypothetical protein
MQRLREEASMGASATQDARPHIREYRIDAKLRNPYAANPFAARNSSASCRTVPAQGLPCPVDARGLAGSQRNDVTMTHTRPTEHRALCHIEAPNVFSQGRPPAGVGYTHAVFSAARRSRHRP